MNSYFAFTAIIFAGREDLRPFQRITANFFHFGTPAGKSCPDENDYPHGFREMLSREMVFLVRETVWAPVGLNYYFRASNLNININYNYTHSFRLAFDFAGTVISVLERRRKSRGFTRISREYTSTVIIIRLV